MARQIVVAFRMPPAGMAPGPEVAYLVRARSLCSRGEALGGRLVAWSAALLAMSWDTDSIEEAVLLAVSVGEESSGERAWACGIAEGELEPLAPDDARMQLAWGQALLSAASLARIARPGDVVVDGEVRALRAGQLSLVGARSATDDGALVRGWRLDVERPWKRPPNASDEDAGSDLVAPADAEPSEPLDPTDAQPTEPVDSAEELSDSDILAMVEASAPEPDEPPPGSRRPPSSALADRVRKLASSEQSAGAIEALAELRRARAETEGGPPAARCQAALALAMTLAIAGRLGDALLEAMDALARAREAQDPKAIGACTALLAKIYAGAGEAGEAAALRESSGVD